MDILKRKALIRNAWMLYKLCADMQAKINEMFFDELLKLDIEEANLTLQIHQEDLPF